MKLIHQVNLYHGNEARDMSVHNEIPCARVMTDIALASFPCEGPARSSLAARNSRSRRGPGLVHHVMSATGYVTDISLRINDVIG